MQTNSSIAAGEASHESISDTYIAHEIKVVLTLTLVIDTTSTLFRLQELWSRDRSVLLVVALVVHTGQAWFDDSSTMNKIDTT